MNLNDVSKNVFPVPYENDQKWKRTKDLSWFKLVTKTQQKP